jgi:RNA polymerase sigma-70 factor, ECF subfamily
MGEDTSGGPRAAGLPKGSLTALFKDHVAVLGRVAMALVGDADRVEAVLEHVAREAGTHGRNPSARGDDEVRPLVWLLGLVRSACAIHLSKLPLRKHLTGPREEAEATERLGAADAIPARIALAPLKPTEREALVLCLVGGLEAADVARACNVDVGTAKTRIAQGIQELLKSEAGRGTEERGAR